MDKYIGFDIDCKKTVACVVQNGKKDVYATFGPDISSMKKFLQNQKHSAGRVHLVFEVSGQAGFIYDSLVDSVDSLTVANPYKGDMDISHGQEERPYRCSQDGVAA